jgi:hypothetical protein
VAGDLAKVSCGSGPASLSTGRKGVAMAESSDGAARLGAARRVMRRAAQAVMDAGQRAASTPALWSCCGLGTI